MSVADYTAVHCRTCRAKPGEQCSPPWRSNGKYRTVDKNWRIGAHKTRRGAYWFAIHEKHLFRCDAVNPETGQPCFLHWTFNQTHGPNHQAWSHYPAQLVVWPYEERND